MPIYLCFIFVWIWSKTNYSGSKKSSGFGFATLLKRKREKCYGCLEAKLGVFTRGLTKIHGGSRLNVSIKLHFVYKFFKTVFLTFDILYTVQEGPPSVDFHRSAHLRQYFVCEHTSMCMQVPPSPSCWLTYVLCNMFAYLATSPI